MDFEIIIGYDGEGFKKAIATDIVAIPQFITAELAQWNNFRADKELNVLIRKVENDTETLTVNVKDEIRTKDIFGQS